MRSNRDVQGNRGRVCMAAALRAPLLGGYEGHTGSWKPPALMHTRTSLFSTGCEPSEARLNTGRIEYPRTESSSVDLSSVVTCTGVLHIHVWMMMVVIYIGYL
jgi:hypothetical protein